MTATLTAPRPSPVIVAISGDLELDHDLTQARQLLTIAHATARADPVVVDLTHLGFIGAAGLRVLSDAARAMASTGTPLTFSGASPHVARLLRFMRLERASVGVEDQR